MRFSTHPTTNPTTNATTATQQYYYQITTINNKNENADSRKPVHDGVYAMCDGQNGTVHKFLM